MLFELYYDEKMTEIEEQSVIFTFIGLLSVEENFKMTRPKSYAKGENKIQRHNDQQIFLNVIFRVF